MRNIHKQSFLRCPETPRGYCMGLLLSPWRTEVPILSTNQRTTCVAREKTLRVSVPQRRSNAREYGAVRLSPGHGHWKRDPYRTFSGLNRPAPCGGNAPCEPSQLFQRTSLQRLTCGQRRTTLNAIAAHGGIDGQFNSAFKSTADRRTIAESRHLINLHSSIPDPLAVEPLRANQDVYPGGERRKKNVNKSRAGEL